MDFLTQIRAGLHIGDLMSGVVGLRMPQFTVFGDTVSTAAILPLHDQIWAYHLSSDLMSGVVGLRMPQFTVFGDTVPPHTVEYDPLIESQLALRN